MKKLMNWMMLSCKKATELVEKQALLGLSPKEQLRLRLHTSLCDGCTAYQKQSLLIDQLLHRHLMNRATETIPFFEHPDLKDRILSKLPV